VNVNEGETKRRLTRAQKWVIGLSVLISALGLANVGRLAMAVYYAGHLPDLPMAVPWTYLAVMGGVWGVAFLACALGLVYFWPWGRWATLIAVTLYEAHVWANHLLFDANEYPRQVWPRDLALTLVLLIVVWGLLNWPSVRREFGQLSRRGD
jgi:hypothetical protein